MLLDICAYCFPTSKGLPRSAWWLVRLNWEFGAILTLSPSHGICRPHFNQMMATIPTPAATPRG